MDLFAEHVLHLPSFFGDLLERLKRHAWKVCIPLKGIEGSNPSVSAVFTFFISTKWCFFFPHLSGNPKHFLSLQIFGYTITWHRRAEHLRLGTFFPAWFSHYPGANQPFICTIETRSCKEANGAADSFAWVWNVSSISERLFSLKH